MVLIIVLSLSAKSQDSLKTSTKSFEFDISVGGAMSSFQDRKYSDLKYSGFGANYGLNFGVENKINNWIWFEWNLFESKTKKL